MCDVLVGKAKRAQEEEEAAVAEASHAPAESGSSSEPPHLPPAPSSEEDVSAALVLKEDANRAFVSKDFERALDLYTQVRAPRGEKRRWTRVGGSACFGGHATSFSSRSPARLAVTGDRAEWA